MSDLIASVAAAVDADAFDPAVLVLPDLILDLESKLTRGRQNLESQR